MEPTQGTSDILTISEVAKLLRCSPQTVGKYMTDCGLPYFQRRPRTRVTFSRAGVLAWYESRQTPITTAAKVKAIKSMRRVR